jgi:hypothetical protein
MKAVRDRCGEEEMQSFFLSPAEQANTPSTLLIAAHPDDETIGAGALLKRRPKIRVIHVTDGSPLNPADAIAAGFTTREEYAEARRKETVQALAQSGVREDAITTLHFTDQQLAFHLKELSEGVLALVRQFQPEIVLTHPFGCLRLPCRSPPEWRGVFLLMRVHGISRRGWRDGDLCVSAR